MKRYTITLGASTTAGGKVISASGGGSINGVQIAVEGDPIFCPACKSQGKILCVEPRIPESWNGKKVALENDLCMCACPSPPRLVPNQSLKCQNLGGGGDDSATYAQTAATPEKNDLLASFRVVDEETGLPMSGVSYSIVLPDGTSRQGVTDADGRTVALTAHERATATLQLGGDTPSDSA
jgi:uncharacterized Zn-binding protein involved in type VI secretion